MRLQKRLNIAFTIALTIAFILLGAFVFRVAYCRTIEALIDLYGSFKYYFEYYSVFPSLVFRPLRSVQRCLIGT